MIAVGATAAIAVTAVGLEPLSYQWQMNVTNLVNGRKYQRRNHQCTDHQQCADEQQRHQYSVIVTNSVGSVTSSVATLTVVRLMVVAWGGNNYGQTNVPVAATNVMAIAGGGYHSLALQTNGTVVAWGLDTSGQTDVPADLTNVVAIAAGYVHSLALQTNGTVVAWGDNTYGQTNVPADLTNVVAIAAAFFHNLALQANGTVVAWGRDDNGQTDVPVDLNNVVAIAGGYAHSLALRADGTVVAWGAGQTNNPSDGVDYGQAIVPAGLTNVVAIAGGYAHSLALRADGTVVAWGAGQTNNPSDGVDYGQAIVPAGLTNVVAIAAGYFHSLALTTNGTVVAWGANDYSETNVPVDLANVVAVAGGYLHSLALENDGSPFIVRQPASQTALTNTTVTFAVIALGAPTLSYQWQVNLANLVDGGNISGATSNVLTISNVQTNDSGSSYTVVITNVAGSVTSSVAILTVTTNISPEFVMQPANQTVAPLSFANIAPAPGGGGGFILSGAGGVSKGTYYVLASSNLLLPQANWTCIATNQFDNNGDFIFTNAAQTNAPQLFYLLKLP